ncbi:MAG: bifunctional 4-hydroxy-2-oxoglutarate aldolase/2-dehydro-3-deoxy-phosphogluconate aldolase [Caulobacteraceae bacterium]
MSSQTTATQGPAARRAVNQALAIEDILRLSPVLPVVTIDDPRQAAPLARALCAGGVGAIEITLRTEAALEAVRRIAGEVPEMAAGVGTVLKPADFKAAAEAGAKFAVSPGATPALMDAAWASTLPYLPAIATPSELMAALEAGVTTCKFFPAAQLGGPGALKALAGPFPAARFCPTGGIGKAEARTYLALANVLCVGGSWIAPREAIAAGDFGRIEALAREACGLRDAQ